MVTCNLCNRNKDVDEMEGMFHYVCKECWKKLKITFPVEIAVGKFQDVEFDKDLLY